MPLKRIQIPSPFYSGRGATVRLIVLHTAEGATTIESLGSWFQNPSAQVSSHTGADDKENTVGEYVSRDMKAWTQANANPYAVAIEACGFAAWSADEWAQHPDMLANIAAWIAEEAAAFGIPIVRLSADEAQSGAAGVCQHVDLGSWGGGHWDCGTGFPMDQVLAMAGGETPAPTPPPPPPPTPPTSTAPAWPYGPDDYLGPPSSDPCCHSGYFGGQDTGIVRQWQTQMAYRGWAIQADGMYGPDSENVCRQFQAEKGLGVDGLVGPQTWSATWTAAVT